MEVAISDPWAMTKMSGMPIEQVLFKPDSFPAWVLYLRRLKLPFSSERPIDQLKPSIIHKIKGKRLSQSFELHHDGLSAKCVSYASPFSYRNWQEGMILQINILDMAPWIVDWLTENEFYP